MDNYFGTTYFSVDKILFQKIFVYNFWRARVILWDHWYPCFGLLVMSALGFKARVDPSLACFIACVQWIPQINLWCNACWPPDGQHGSQAFLIHILVQEWAMSALLNGRNTLKFYFTTISDVQLDHCLQFWENWIHTTYTLGQSPQVQCFLYIGTNNKSAANDAIIPPLQSINMVLLF